MNLMGAKIVKMEEPMVEKCQKVINGLLESPNKNWVLFKNQTFVILDDSELTKQSASEKATGIMKKYGPVYAGSPAGDFNVINDSQTKGWIVTGHCESMFTYVDMKQAKQQDGIMVIGLVGRGDEASRRRKPGNNSCRTWKSLRNSFLSLTPRE